MCAATADDFAEGIHLLPVAVRLRKKRVVFFVVKNLVDVALRHQLGQGFSLCCIFQEQGLDFLNPAHRCIIASAPYCFQIRFQDNAVGENQLVDHRHKSSLNSVVPDVFHGAAVLVLNVGVAAPRNVFVCRGGVHSTLEGIAALAADDFAGKAVSDLVFFAAFDDAFFLAALLNQSICRLKDLTADDGFMVICHRVLIFLTVIDMAIELRIGIGLLVGVAAVGASLLTAATIKIVDYFKSRKTNNLEIEIAKEELIKGIKEYDAAHPDEEGGNEDE